MVYEDMLIMDLKAHHCAVNALKRQTNPLQLTYLSAPSNVTSQHESWQIRDKSQQVKTQTQSIESRPAWLIQYQNNAIIQMLTRQIAKWKSVNSPKVLLQDLSFLCGWEFWSVWIARQEFSESLCSNE